jgi:hypothetical protein
MFRTMKTFLVLACIAQSAFALEPTISQHELSGGTAGAVNLNNGTTLAIDGAYNYLLSPGIQLGAKAGFSYYSSGAAVNVGGISVSTNTTQLLLLAGPTLNYPMNDHLNNAAFLTVMAGIAYTNALVSNTNFAFQVEVGKRFALWDHVTYKPSVAMTKVSGSDALITVTPLAFSFLF